MKKMVWLLLLGLLIACGPTTTELVPPEPNDGANTAVSTTPESAQTNEDVSESATDSVADLDAFVPATNMAEAAVTRAQDWRKGASDPLVVIIEYGDFQ